MTKLRIVKTAPARGPALGDVIYIQPRDRRRKPQIGIVTALGPPFRKLSKKRFAKIQARIAAEEVKR